MKFCLLIDFIQLCFLRNIIYLAASGLSCDMWDLVPLKAIGSEPPVLGAQGFSHWTTRGVLTQLFKMLFICNRLKILI